MPFLPPNQQRQSTTVVISQTTATATIGYSTAKHRVPQLIPVLGIKAVVSCHCFLPGLQLPPQPIRRLLPISLLVEQRHDGCEQFAYDCYRTASRLRFEPGPFCA